MSLPIILSGTTLWISESTPISQTVGGFSALNFTQIRAIKFVGDIEKAWQTFQQSPIDDNRIIQTRSFFTLSNVTFEMVAITDAGQALLSQSIDSEDAYSFKLLRNNGTGAYFTAKGIKRRNGNGDSSSIYTLTIELAIETSPIDF